MSRLHQLVGILENLLGLLLVVAGYLLYADLLGVRGLLGIPDQNAPLYSSILFLSGFLSLIGGLLLMGRREKA